MSALWISSGPAPTYLRHNKRLTRLNRCGHTEANAQWSLYCMAHNIEKLLKAGLGQSGIQ
jgi:hypothetical protein